MGNSWGGGGGGKIQLIESTDSSLSVGDGSGPTVDLTGAGSGGAPGGDLSGANIGAAEVIGIQGSSISGTATNNQILRYNGTNWLPITLTGPTGPLTGDVTTSGNAATLVGTANVESIIWLQPLSSLAAPTSSLNINSQRLLSVGTPAATTDGNNSLNRLIAATYYEPASTQSKLLSSTALAAIDTTNLTLSFTAISTVVVIELEAFVGQLSGTVLQQLYFALFTHSTTTQVGYTTTVISSTGTDATVRVKCTIRITGLTAGTAYQVDWAWGTNLATDSWLMAIGANTGTTAPSGPAIMRAYAG